jgi:hypothetical protein
MSFKLRHKFLKISMYLKTALAAETHLAEGQRLEAQQSMEKLLMLPAGTLMPTASRIKGHGLAPL